MQKATHCAQIIIGVTENEDDDSNKMKVKTVESWALNHTNYALFQDYLWMRETSAQVSMLANILSSPANLIKKG